MNTKTVIIHPLEQGHYELLFKWFTNLDDLPLWSDEREIYSFKDFVLVLKNRLKFFYNLFYVLELEGESIGFAYTYKTNPVDQYSYLCLYLAPDKRGQKLGVIAGYNVLKYLFTNFGYRKIYAEIYEYNKTSLNIVTENGFNQEGMLKLHRKHGDRYWDLIIFAITKETFLGISQPLITISKELTANE